MKWKKKLLLPCPPASKTMMKNPVKLCDLKKQTKISIEPVFDREFLTWAALIRYEIEVQKFSWVDFHLDEKSPM